MLFSNEHVAAFITANFEPVWEMVRPVPLVHINFGNGVEVTRTLHGNIATSVCSAEGLVLDVLPGIYEPRTYLDCLQQFRLLENYARQANAGTVQAYHEKQALALRKNQRPERFLNVAPISKRVIEGGIKAVLMPGESTANAVPVARVAPPPSFSSAGELATWKALAEDTRLNESTRRMQIHDLLAGMGMVRPEKILKPLYKKVLHADLDDPYLGLGSALFGDYPFAKEDAAAP